jgi:hypothetical protein
MNKTTSKKVSYNELHLDLPENARVHRSEQLVAGVNVDTYAIPALMGQVLVADGEIFEPLHVEDVKGKLFTRRGHRRTLVAQLLGKMKDAELWKHYRSAKLSADINANISEEPDPKAIKTIRTHLDNIPVVVHKDLTPEERIKLIHDQDQKGLTRTDVVKTVYKMLREGRKEADISTKMLYQLAAYSGNVAKLNTLSDDPTERAKEIKEWFHGLVGAYFIPTYREGPAVQEQVLLTAMVEDGLLHREKRDKAGKVIQAASDKLPDFLLTHNRWNKIKKAFNQDVNKGIIKAESPVMESSAVKKLCEEFRNSDLGIKPQRAADPRPSLDQIKQVEVGVKSSVGKKLAEFYKTGVPVDGFTDDDEKLANLEQKVEVVEANLSKVFVEKRFKGETVQQLLASLVNDTVADFERMLAKFCEGMEVVETPDTSDEKHAAAAK